VRPDLLLDRVGRLTLRWIAHRRNRPSTPALKAGDELAHQSAVATTSAPFVGASRSQYRLTTTV